MFSRIANFALAWQKHQDVAATTTFRACPKFIDRIGNGVLHAVIAAFFKGAVALLYREGAARHHEHRRGLACSGIGKMARKALGIDGGRGDDDF